MLGFKKPLLAFYFLLPFSVNNHCYFVLLASVFFLVVMCLQNIKSPENCNNKKKLPRKIVLKMPHMEQVFFSSLFFKHSFFLSLSFLAICQCQWSIALGTKAGHGAQFLHLYCNTQMRICLVEGCLILWLANAFPCSLVPHPDTRHRVLIHSCQCLGTASLSPTMEVSR